MSRKVLIGIFITAFLAVFAYYSFMQVIPREIENEPDWQPLNIAIDQATDGEKYILVDIFEVGCQWCRKMSREVYPSPTIRAILDRDFVSVKINGNSDSMITYRGEEMTEKEFASRMGVTAFPFTVILDNEGNIIDRRRGYMDTQGLSRFLKDAIAEETAP
jgi:thioredoxin-related protein